jgi:sterol desaturase/sphingolipid hydroxylase (fatty acid hydroxylase superfamily)
MWFALWVVLPGVLRHRKVRAETPPALQLVSEFAHSVRSVAIFSLILTIPAVAWQAGWRAWEAQEAAMTGPWWFWGTVAVILVAHDAYFYWMHRTIHRPRLFRRYHRRHHRSFNPSPFTAYSFDLREAALEIAFFAGWTLLLPEPDGTVMTAVLIQLFINTLHHSGYELMPSWRGRPMFDFLTTTVHHDLHHARGQYNLGLYFTWWDRMMGTEDPTYHVEFARVVGQQEAAQGAVPAPA